MSEPDEKVPLHLAKPDAKSLIALYEKLSGKKATPRCSRNPKPRCAGL
jgi:hypothetical protein